VFKFTFSVEATLPFCATAASGASINPRHSIKAQAGFILATVISSS
jgi:hypothetical protein